MRRLTKPYSGVLLRVCLTARRGIDVGGSHFQESSLFGANQKFAPVTSKLSVVLKPSDTLLDIWDQAIRVHPTRRFLGVKMFVRGRLGYVWSTFETIDKEIAAARHLLHGLGVEKGSRVVVVSDNRYEWVVVHFATLQLGAHFVCLPTNITPSEAQLVVVSTLAKVMFVETLSSYASVQGWEGTVGHLQHIFCFDDQTGPASYAVAINVAEDVPEKIPPRKDVVCSDTAMIMFTAGTTGQPKGVMLSHKAIVANISSAFAIIGEATTENDLFLSLCPWTVAGAMPIELYQVICKGAQLAIPPELLEGYHDIKIINPSVIVTVAQPLSRAYGNIVDDILVGRNRIASRATRWALGKLTSSRLMFQKPSLMMKTISNFLLARYKRQFGTELRICFVVGSTLIKEQMDLFADLDLFCVNTYGCLESGGIVATDIDVPGKLKTLPGVEVRIVNHKNEVVAPGDLGEVLVEAPHAMQGYFDIHIDPEESKNALVVYGSRTFVRAGDYGSLTGGWLTLKGHKDTLITLSNGKTVDPNQVEIVALKSPFIKQAFIFGHNRPYVVALIVPNSRAIASQLKKLERRDGTPILTDREKADAIRDDLRRVSSEIPIRSQIRRYAFVEEFSQANGFLTAKHQFARQKIEKHYVHFLNALYDETPKFFGFAVDDYDDLF
jgi:long-chain acyl-CoA synthetase